MQVFAEMFERVEHRLCLRHLYANFKKRFGGGVKIRDLMMGAAKATYYQAWEEKMQELKKIDQKAWEWLMGVPTTAWCKHAFSFYSKCDVLMNNLSESFNSTILVARDRPILTMCEWIRSYLMNRMAKNRLKLTRWQYNVMPNPRKRIDKEIVLSGQWAAHWSKDQQWQVENFMSKAFIVDLEKWTCTCNFWQLVGIPCRHAIAAMSFESRNPEDYVHACYLRATYEKCYNHGVSPINGQDRWPAPDVEIEEMLPPEYKRGPGRPKKLRIRECGEVNGGRFRRPGVGYRCTKCNKLGHNAGTCKSTTQDPEAAKRKVK
jgi:hypothetical protein